MSTFILAILIFGSAGVVVYYKIKKKGCTSCHTTCQQANKDKQNK